MIGYISAGIEDLLTAHSVQLLEERDRESQIEVRADNVSRTHLANVRTGLSYSLGGVNIRLSEGGITLEDQQRFVSRVYCAAVLGLAGEQDPNAGHSKTRSIVLGRKVVNMDLKYKFVAATLHGVATNPSVESQLDGSWNPMVVNPSDITEGHALVHAAIDPEDVCIIGSYGAWIADHDMPADFQGRSDYVEPARIGHLARSMLEAINNRRLNPFFGTVEFVGNISGDLLAAVEDVATPLDRIDVAAYLPEWLSRPIV